MNLISVTDIESPEIQIYRKLRDNAVSEGKSLIADSPKVINVLLESDLEIKSILATEEYYDAFASLIESRNVPTLYVADKKLMENIVGHKVHHNAMMHGVRPHPAALNQLGDQILMLDEISSSENIGSIARSAAAMGVKSYLLPQQGPHPYSRRSLRVSMGHVSKLKFHLYDDIFTTLDALKENGYQIFAAEVTEEAVAPSSVKVPEKWVLLMGHEGKGLSSEVIARCDQAVQIEMEPGVRSLNVGVAASIMMYRFRHGSQ